MHGYSYMHAYIDHIHTRIHACIHTHTCIPTRTHAHRYVDAAEFWLEADAPGSASQQIKKAHQLLSKVKDEDLKIAFKLAFARISDRERKFEDAARRYVSAHLSWAMYM